MKLSQHFVQTRYISALAAGCVGTLGGISMIAASPPAWEKPRQLSDFQFLLKRSPFSLPTAEESSPLAERYAMTGIITIGGHEQVFVMDRNDQSRELLTQKPNAKNMALVSILREGNSPPQKATIRVGEETGTIGYLEASQQQVAPVPAQAAQRPANVSGSNTPGARPGVQLPPLPRLPQNPVTGPQNPQTQTPPTRRLIRRPVVMPQQSQPTAP